MRMILSAIYGGTPTFFANPSLATAEMQLAMLFFGALRLRSAIFPLVRSEVKNDKSDQKVKPDEHPPPQRKKKKSEIENYNRLILG